MRRDPPGRSTVDEARRPRTRYKLRPVPVQDFMDRNNMTQKQMAELLGISDAYFSQIMNGDRSPSARVRASLQQVMGVSDFDELFFVEEDDED